MEIEERLLSINDMSRCGKKQNKISKILIKKIDKDLDTVNRCYNYFENLKYQSDIFNSYHYIIDSSGLVLKLIPDYEVSFPIGHPKFDNNKISIGLSFKNYTKELEKQLINLIHYICIKYSLHVEEDVMIEYDILNTRNMPIFIDNRNILNSILKQCMG